MVNFSLLSACLCALCVQAIHALDNGNLYEAYELYLAAGKYNPAHDLAVLELAPDAVLRKDLDLLRSLFERFAGRPVEGWHVRGKVCPSVSHPEICLTFFPTGVAGLRSHHRPSA